MSDVKKLAADAAAAREKINQGIAERRETEATLVEAIADDVYAQHARGVRWADTVAHFGCSSSVYYSARKRGKERAEAAAEAARKAEAEAEAERKAAARKAAAESANEMRALALRLAAEADAAIAAEAEAKRKAEAACEIPATQTTPNAPADDKMVNRETVDAMAQIIESALVAHGISLVGRINRSVNTKGNKNRGAINRPIFIIEIRTDWRPADGVVMPTANSAAPADEIGKLQAGCDGLRAVLAMAQTQLNNMIAAKGIKP